MVSLTKITFGINVPYQSTEIDWEATDKKRKEKDQIIFEGLSETTKEYLGKKLHVDWVRVPCISKKDLFFELCENCGNQITGGRLSRGLRSCSPECNKNLGGAWRHHTLEKERNLNGKRPMFFWWKIRNECFERDGYICQNPKCHKGPELKMVDITGWDYEKKDWITVRTEERFVPPPDLEAHHIVPVSQGGSNKLDNLKTLCYDCHKSEHSHVGNVKRKHRCLEVD